ncbi:serine/threonine-protein kinase [Acrasis kona]|uniref:Serine/threonine-protein kinase n=1 Tax=Acrasis kona TaxID=1008807 RepID=A0AAW2Z9M4_9EUKA
MSLRRLSKILNNKDETHGGNGKGKSKTSLSFELIKVNRHGQKQSRTLNMTNDGLANMKGKNVQWFFPAKDVYCIQQHPDSSKLTLRVVKEYDFEAQTPQQANQIVTAFYDLYSEDLEKSYGQIPAPISVDASSQRDHPSPSSVKKEPVGLSFNDFEMLKLIGQGSFSKVCLVKKKDTGKLYAMKVLLKNELKKRNQVEHTNTERKILAKYQHPFLVKLHYSFQTQDKLYMCLEYVDGGELFYHLKRARRFPENLACFYAAEILLAINFLHSNDIVYRDLKPENILVDLQGHLKLTDFGLSKAGVTSMGGSTEGSKTRTFCGTPDYLAPEVIQGCPHGKAVDYWGLGVLLYEMLTGQPPFRGKNRNELYEQVLRMDVGFPEHVSANARSLVSALLTKKPEERLGAQKGEDVQNHPFFQGIDWQKLLDKQIEPPFKPIAATNAVIEQVISQQDMNQIMPSDDGAVTLGSSPSFSNFSYSSDSPITNGSSPTALKLSKIFDD